MIPNNLSATFAALAPALGNHLWQSTLFAIAAGLLTLILRKNHARARYWVWLAASMKFLIPFSLLIGLGSRLAWSRGTVGTNAGLYFAMDKVGQPFTQPAISIISRVPPLSVSSSLIQLLPSFLAAVWLGGFLAVVFVWYLRWRRVSRALRHAEPLREGREVETLLRLQRIAGRGKPIEMFLSGDSLEPGIFGIARPVLVWPKGISERLGDAHLEAILAHEVWHVRRRDNLAAALHMLVEAIFWFHPLVWWLGTRLVEERERACDEAVLESGSNRQVYAESILKICEFCVESPLACVSGVTGADLKRRIARIMAGGFVRKLDFTKKLLLSAAASAAIAVPIMLGLLNATQSRAQSQAHDATAGVPAFEAASITPNKNGEPMAGFKIKGRPAHAIMWKPDRFMATNFSLPMLLQRVYDVQAEQILGGPAWLNSENFDVDAQVDKSVADDLGKLTPDQSKLERQRMLQVLFADRFKLTLHHETRELPVYVLVIPTNGPKIQPSKPGDTYPNGLKRPDNGQPQGPGEWWPEEGKIIAQGVSVSSLVRSLSQKLGGRIVVDKTGLTGDYDFTLQWTPEENQAALFTAIQEQLGLKLETQKLPIDVLVIDHAEKPAEPRAQNTTPIVPAFETASIKPNKTGEPMAGFSIQGRPASAIRFKPDRFMATNVPLHALIAAAYEVEGSEILGGPGWVRSENYDVEEKLGTPVIDELRKLGPDQRLLEQKRILQALLADRFRLALHRETREPPAYVLAIAKDGLKLQEAKPGDTYPDGFKDPEGRPLGAGALLQPGPCKLLGQGVHMADLAKTLSTNYLGGRTVVDQTSLRGVYDFTLDCHTAFTEHGESVLTVLPEQLGLELKLLDMLVIDSAEKPPEN